MSRSLAACVCAVDDPEAKKYPARPNSPKEKCSNRHRLAVKEVVSAEGIESAQKRKFNNMQGHGWQESA